MNSHSTALPLAAGKRILVMLPDDGTDRRLIKALRRDHGVMRADSVPVRSVAALQQARTKRGRLPEPVLAKLVTVLVNETEADAVFDSIYVDAKLGRPGGGMALMERPLAVTTYVLPEGLPDES